ncbi:MAG: CPBP family intramembrane metalloprotease [Clostridia bacterium]|nr:CPBP family intramembrane metalloprotease [Clostridia bacterium]
MQEKTAAKTFSLLLCTIGLYLLLWQLLSKGLELPVYYYGRLIELLGMGLFIALAICTPMKFEEMGIVTSKKTLFRSLSLGGGIALLVFLLCAAAGAIMGSDPFFSFRFGEDISQVTYFFVVPVQEILAKSVMYYSFERCLGREHPHQINLLSALTFGIFHVAYGTEMMLLSMALTLLTGWIFRHYRCVWGCALAHFAFGFFPTCFGL